MCEAEWRSSSSGDMDMAERSESLPWRVIKLANDGMNNDDLKKLLTNPDVFPVELTLTSGDKVRIGHPDYVHFAQKKGQIFFWPQEDDINFEWIEPLQIAKIRAKVRKSHAA